MPNLLFGSCLFDALNGDIIFPVDVFNAMLVTSEYLPNPDHARRSDVRGEVAASGYDAGGKFVPIGLSRDDANRNLNVVLGGAVWPSSNITARGAVYYKRRGGAAFDDELVAYIDFRDNIVGTRARFVLVQSVIQLQLP